MPIKRKLKVAGKALALTGSLFLLTACQGEQKEITSNHSSISVARQESAKQSDEERKLKANMGRSETWARKVVAASKEEEIPAPVEEPAPVEAPVEEVLTETVPAEEPAHVEEVMEEPVYEIAQAESSAPVVSIVEESVPTEPVYTYEHTEEEVSLPFPKQYTGNPQMDNDQVAYYQYGVDGKEIRTWRHVYEDGVLIDSHITKTIRVEPIPEISVVGTNIVVIPGHSSYEKELAKMKELYPDIYQ